MSSELVHRMRKGNGDIGNRVKNQNGKGNSGSTLSKRYPSSLKDIFGLFVSKGAFMQLF